MKNTQLFISNNINEDDSLYRYISLAQFISLIENKKLYLKKIKLWDDPWEAPDDQIPLEGPDGTCRAGVSMIASSTVGQCWTYEKDSDAMWRIYSPDRQGVMIETSVHKFRTIQNLRQAVLSKVIYYNLDDYIEKRKEIAENRSYAYAGDMALKREAFKHENEVRLLICLQAYGKEIDNKWDIPVVGFDIEPLEFLNSITFDPRADDWFVEAMLKYCESKGLNCPISKSDLYEKDFYTKAKIVRRWEIVK